MKNHRPILLFICLLPKLLFAQFVNNAGTTINMDFNTSIILDNIDFKNNGSFYQAGGTVKFTGSATNSITTTAASQFYNIVMAKVGGMVLLRSNINLSQQLLFTNGILELNGNNILMSGNAFFGGENDNSHVTGAAGGYVQVTNTLKASNTITSGSIGVVMSTTQNMGLTTIRRSHIPQLNVGGSGSSIARSFTITPTYNTGLNATLRIIYLNSELDGLAKNTLSFWNSSNGNTWNYTGADKIDTANNYVEKSGINSFGSYTLAKNAVLPVVWSSFYTTCANGNVTISWKTLLETDTQSFTVQRSSDGIEWKVIASLKAAGNNTAVSNYTYTDIQPLGGNSYYRVLEQDKDGNQTFSPIIENSCGSNEAIRAYPNPVVQNNIWVSIQTTTTDKVLLQLYDAKGAMIKQQNESLQNGSNQVAFQLDNLPKGFYSLIIHLDNGNTKAIKVEKL